MTLTLPTQTALPAENRVVLTDSLDRAVRTLFSHYDTPVEETQVGAQLDLIAVVGLNDEQLRGAVAIGLGTNLLQHLYSSMLGPAATPAGLADLLGELCNQTAGRFKAELSAFGLHVQLSTPMMVRGTDIEVHPAQAAIQIHYDTPHGPLCVWLGVDCPAPLVAQESATPSIETSVLLEF